MLAAAGRAAAAAVTEPGLLQSLADSLADQFADWAIVDVVCDGQPRRAVASHLAAPLLSRELASARAQECPLVQDAITRNTPAVMASLDDPRLLGALPDGRPVADALHAHSAAVGPISADGSACCGAITIVRGPERPYVGFGELQALSRVADLAAAAMNRLRRR
ncbi:MAG: hypothetical protein JOY82_10535 [Streptosporangiaceae bacterium]|nr:hypothetical protein [Streptosporangiaceae bacterium]MBV9854943.1 hypothetical protein [Streptosporangiaceae bacterium]